MRSPLRRTVVVFAATLGLQAGGLVAQDPVTGRASSIRLGGRLQAQYATSSVDGAAGGFFFRRARVLADIRVNDFVDARLQPEFAGGTVGLRDAWIRLRFSPVAALTIGQFKRAFDLFELDSSTDMSLIERDGRIEGVDRCTGVGSVCTYSRFTEKLGFSDRDIGVKLAGGTDRLEYQLSITNGTGTNVRDENDAKSFAARVALALTDHATFGAQWGLHDYRTDSGDDAYAAAWAADLQYGRYRDGVLLQAALVSGANWRNPDAAGEPTPFLAFQALASVYAPRAGDRWVGVEPLIRLTHGDPDTQAPNDGGLVFTPGLMLYLGGRNKIGFNLDLWSPQDGDTEYSLKVQSFLYF